MRVARLLAAVLLLSACLAAACGSRQDGGGSLAVVLTGPPFRLVVVDLDAGRVLREKPLCSMAFDLTLDRGMGLAVTAQTGGVGDQADERVGIYDVRRDSAVQYVALRKRNPLLVVARDGLVYVNHGMVVDGGLYTSVVDLRTRSVTTTTVLPDGPGMLQSAGGWLWTLSGGPGGGPEDEMGTPPSLARVDPVSLEVTLAAGPVSGVNGVAGDEKGAIYLVGAGQDASAAGRAVDSWSWIAEFDPVSRRVLRRSGLLSLRRPARSVCVAGDAVVVSCWDGEDPSDEGTEVLVVDRATLRARRSLRIPGGPCSMAAWGERVVIVERKTATLLVLDVGRGAIVRRIPLGGPEPIMPDVEVLPAGQGHLTVASTQLE